jgi:hypothetical protein
MAEQYRENSDIFFDCGSHEICLHVANLRYWLHANFGPTKEPDRDAQRSNSLKAPGGQSREVKQK